MLNRQLRRIATSCIKLLVISGAHPDEQRQIAPPTCHISARVASLRDAHALATSGCLPFLQHLQVANGHRFCSGPPPAAIGFFAAATQLTSLDIVVPQASNLDVLCHCPGLRSLTVKCWYHPVSIPTALTNLRELVLDSCSTIVATLLPCPRWARLRVLQGLTVGSQAELVEWARLLTVLTRLEVNVAYSAREGGDLSPLSRFSLVEALTLHAYLHDSDLAPVAALIRLTHLRVRSNFSWSVINQLYALRQLASLDLSLRTAVQGPQLSRLLGMNLGGLTHLGLSFVQGVGSNITADLSAVLSRASGLVSLCLPLEKKMGLGRLPHVFSALSCLTSLKLTMNFGVGDLDLRPRFVAQLSLLLALDLRAFMTRAHGLQALAGLSSLTCLRLCVSNLVTADETRCLGRLSRLESLYVSMPFPREVRLIAPPHYPIALFEVGFGDLQSVRRGMGWQDLEAWRWHTLGRCWVGLFWGLPGHHWDHIHGFG